MGAIQSYTCSGCLQETSQSRHYGNVGPSWLRVRVQELKAEGAPMLRRLRIRNSLPSLSGSVKRLCESIGPLHSGLYFGTFKV